MTSRSRTSRTNLRRIGLAFFAVAALTITATGPASAQVDSHWVNWDALGANVGGVLLNVPPAGANNTSCVPSAEHPDPVILLHGLLQNQNMAWQALAPTLANKGYCVYTMTYGQVFYSGNSGGIDDMTKSAAKVNTFVNTVLGWSGASKVDLVGYSEGGHVARLFLKNFGATHVKRVVGISAPNAGPTTVSDILTYAHLIPGAAETVAIACPACNQLSTQPAYDYLNSPATVPSVTYTNVATTKDEVVTPYKQAFLPAASNVTNFTIQDLCPNDKVGHLGMTYDKTAVQLTLNALDPAHPAAVPCNSGFPAVAHVPQPAS